jgi:hypothetical protein
VLYLFKSILVYHDRHRKSDRQAFLVLVERNLRVMGRLQVDSFYTRLREGYQATPFVSQGIQVSEPDEKGLRWTEAKQIFIPDFDDLRSDCIDAVHAPTFSGHFGIFRTYKKLQEVFYWPNNMRKDVDVILKRVTHAKKLRLLRSAKLVIYS